MSSKEPRGARGTHRASRSPKEPRGAQGASRGPEEPRGAPRSLEEPQGASRSPRSLKKPRGAPRSLLEPRGAPCYDTSLTCKSFQGQKERICSQYAFIPSVLSPTGRSNLYYYIAKLLTFSSSTKGHFLLQIIIKAILHHRKYPGGK